VKTSLSQSASLESAPNCDGLYKLYSFYRNYIHKQKQQNSLERIISGFIQCNADEMVWKTFDNFAPTVRAS
jgi:hypothetical protein